MPKFKVTQSEIDRLSREIAKNIFSSSKIPESELQRVVDKIDLSPIVESIIKQIPDVKDGVNGINGLDGKNAEVTEDHIEQITVLAIDRIKDLIPEPIPGVDGIQGLKGETGVKGEQGQRGERGETGKKGQKGDKGDQGFPGKDGINGKDGRDGIDGQSFDEKDIEKIVSDLNLSNHVLKKDLDKEIKSLIRNIERGVVRSPQNGVVTGVIGSLQKSYNSGSKIKISARGPVEISDENDLGNGVLRAGKVSTEDYTVIESDGTIESKGEATAWDDISNSIIAARLDISSGRLDYDYFNGGISYQSNARYPEEPVVIPLQFRHAQLYGVGAVLRPHMHWLQSQSAVPNFLLAYKIVNQGETTTFETDYRNYQLIIPTGNAFNYASGTLAQITMFGEIDASGITISGAVNFVLFRDSANASGLFAGSDPVGSNVTVTYQDQHAKFNMFGSREEYVK